MSRPSTGDIIAGISVALVAIPQSLAYAELAGLPAQYGLFASALPPLAAALFVSSRYLQTGPVALTALLTFGALSTLAEPGSPEYIGLAALLALLVGLFRLLLGLAKMGKVAYLLSEPLLTGFTTGAAVIIIASQLPKVFDARIEGRGVVVDAWFAITRFDDWSWPALGFAALAAIFMVVGQRVHKRFPGVLLAVVLATVISGAIGYAGTIVGELDGGFVTLGFDFEWGAMWTLLIPAAAIGLVGFAEPASIARSFAAEERQPWNADREMISQGVANLAAAISGAFPVGGSFSRSSLSRIAGATSPWAGAITGAFVLLTLPLTPLLENLPSSVLGAIVIVGVLKLVKFRQIFAVVPLSPAQGLVGFGTFVATLVTAPRIERAVLIGIGLSLGVHLYREMSVSADSVRTGDVLRVSPQGVLWFATVPIVDRLIRDELAASPDIKEVVVDLSGVGRLDFTGASSLARIADELVAAGIAVRTANIPPGASRAAGIHLTAHAPKIEDDAVD